MEDYLLKVERLGIAFRQGEHLNAAVHDSTFQLGPGKTLAIVGESGSGLFYVFGGIVGLDVQVRRTTDVTEEL